MTITSVRVLALVLAGVSFFALGAAHAASMRCSDLHATCVADCRKSTNKAAVPTCITNCGQSRGACLRTGCWNGGSLHFCNLARR